MRAAASRHKIRSATGERFSGFHPNIGGSSFEILVKLVRRLPAMVCPRWTQTRMQPIAVEDVVKLLAFAVGRQECYRQTFDVGAPEAVSYRDLMLVCAEVLGLRRTMLPVRLFTPSLSKLWVSLVTGAPGALVGPLVESLKHEMVARDLRLAEMAGLRPTPVRIAIERALALERASTLRRGRATPARASLVQSVQRMRLPPNGDARWAATEYARWLPSGLWGLVRVEVDVDETMLVFLSFLKMPALMLLLVRAPSTQDRQLYLLRGGLLSRKSAGGRLEFRQMLDGDTLLVAIHDYAPSLPWFIYLFAQAPIHAAVMTTFRRHLARQQRTDARAAGLDDTTGAKPAPPEDIGQSERRMR